MADRRIGSGAVAAIIALGVLVAAVAVQARDSDGDVDKLAEQMATATTPAPPAIATAPTVGPPSTTSIPAQTPAMAPPSLPAVSTDAYQLLGVVVDHDIQFPGTPEQRWVLQVFLRGPDALTYVYVSEEVWKSCPVPGEFMIDRCVPEVSYRPEVTYPPPSAVG